MKNLPLPAEEIWKDIPGYEGYYQASTFGRIKSMKRKMPAPRGGFMTLKSKLKNPTIQKTGYLLIQLSKKGVSKYFLVHRLVAITFIENPLRKREVNHLNEDKTDNYYKNLKWATPKENTNHGTCIKRRSQKKKIIIGRFDKNLYLLKVYSSLKEVKSKGFNKDYVSKCAKRQIDEYKGFIWREINVGANFLKNPINPKLPLNYEQ